MLIKSNHHQHLITNDIKTCLKLSRNSFINVVSLFKNFRWWHFFLQSQNIRDSILNVEIMRIPLHNIKVERSVDAWERIQSHCFQKQNIFAPLLKSNRKTSIFSIFHIFTKIGQYEGKESFFLHCHRKRESVQWKNTPNILSKTCQCYFVSAYSTDIPSGAMLFYIALPHKF